MVWLTSGSQSKTLIILTGNGLCAYALARSYTDSVLVALGAASLAIINPLVIQDINKTGLRQVTLWWLLLFPVFLQRAGRTGHMTDGVLAGICFALVSAFYWFYGLFAGLFGIFWVVWWFVKEKTPMASCLALDISSGSDNSDRCILLSCALLFRRRRRSGPRRNREAARADFFLSYPAYDTVASAPQRPSNYRENVLLSASRD